MRQDDYSRVGPGEQDHRWRSLCTGVLGRALACLERRTFCWPSKWPREEGEEAGTTSSAPEQGCTTASSKWVKELRRLSDVFREILLTRSFFKRENENL